MHKFILANIFILGTLLHVFFLDLNQILKIADSFAYLQMAHFLTDFDLRWFGTGWFGFLYSLPIAIVNIFGWDPFLTAQITNLILFIWVWCLTYRLWSLYLDKAYVYILLILLFISPILLHYNIHILSENIYIPLFLWLYLSLHRWSKNPEIWQTIKVTFILALLYLTRGEAFIYIFAFYILVCILFCKQKISFSALCKYVIIITLFFTLFVSPYIYFLFTKTGELGLTNKWASNLRQAQLRGIEKLDDAGFEQAVAELTDDKHYLIAGFAGGMEYNTPSIDLNLKDYFIENKQDLFDRFILNQKKLYSVVLPKLLLKDQLKAYYDWYQQDDPFKLFLIFLILLPWFFITIGLYKIMISHISLMTGDRNFIWNYLPFFLIASVFFTLFFVLERYFIVFLPLALIVMCYGIQYTLVGIEKKLKKILYFIILLLLIAHGIIGLNGYYHSHESDDDNYLVKRTAGIWLNENIRCEAHICSEIKKNSREKLINYKYDTDFKILERFPIVTYYSGTKHRYITPYTESLADIIEYARFNDIDFLIVDSLDFIKYRPGLQKLLVNQNNHTGLKHVKSFLQNDQRVIIYQIRY